MKFNIRSYSERRKGKLPYSYYSHTYFFFFVTETDECKSSPCLNGGTCVDGLYDFSCVCTILFIGKRCEGSVTSHNLVTGV